jgi:hypothetical protein
MDELIYCGIVCNSKKNGTPNSIEKKKVNYVLSLQSNLFSCKKKKKKASELFNNRERFQRYREDKKARCRKICIVYDHLYKTGGENEPTRIVLCVHKGLKDNPDGN